MKLLVILSRLPYPLEKGDKLRAYHQLRELNKKNEVILCCLTTEDSQEKHLAEVRKVCNKLHVFKLTKWRIYLNLLFAFFSRKPFQVHYFYQRSIHKTIQKIISDSEPDHIFCQLLRTAEYAKNEHNYRKTIDYQDAFSKGMERRADRARFPLREVFNLERKRLVAYENIIFEYFETKVIISDEDRKHIYHPERQYIHIITNGIDTDFFHPSANRVEEFDLVFVGNMSYPPNIETAEFIVEKVLPLLQSKFPDIKLLLAGAEPTKKVQVLANQKGVTLRAGLEDIREAYGSGKIFFAPMLIGTGLQNKLLEAMAMEKPCVTSDLANKALMATHRENILVGATPEDYTKLISELMGNPDLRIGLGENGRKYVQGKFSWESSTNELANLMFAQSDELVV
ncbi:MAG: sugar transferase (PEP-CTERM/EpsH1 system associated) [Cryomorphaceae bacterium]|jgi:sugar transferase (PEP-CTERM/EpsH1 system associated)